MFCSFTPLDDYCYYLILLARAHVIHLDTLRYSMIFYDTPRCSETSALHDITTKYVTQLVYLITTLTFVLTFVLTVSLALI